MVFLAGAFFAAPLLAEAFAVGSALAAAFVAVLAGAFFAVAGLAAAGAFFDLTVGT